VADDIVVVETVSGVIEAELIRSLLESAGIIVELSHEAALSVYSLGIGRMARVDILVRKDQEAAAMALLNDYRSGRLETTETDSPEDFPPQPSV
jgi:hypothetical protein